MTISSRRRTAIAMASTLLASCGGSGSDLPPNPHQPPKEAPHYTEIHHLVSYGQSLSVGALAVPAITTIQRHYSLRFSGGVRSGDLGSSVDASYASLIPLIESSVGKRLGETPTAGALEQINELIQAEDMVEPHAGRVAYLGSAPGEGSRSIGQLSKGTPPFEHLIQDIHEGSRLARTAGKGYSLGAVLYTQGEKDYRIDTRPNAYAAALEKLRADIETVAGPEATGQKSLPMILGQTASHTAYDRSYPGIALAQLAASQMYSNIHLAGPTYQFDYADPAHLTNRSSKWLGAYYGLAYKRAVLDGRPWRPLEPLSARIKGSRIEIAFHVPVPPLVFDTLQVSNPGQYGFEVFTAEKNVAMPIRSAEIEQGQLVTLQLDRMVPDGALVRYAFAGGEHSGRLTGPRGNLRDSQGDHLLFDADWLQLRMDNWCVIFEMPAFRD